MQVDGRSVPKGTSIAADICIVGAGAAGITLALRLEGAPLKVVVLESGGLEPDSETQSLGDGRVIGLPYFPLSASRLRCFGGTTAHWGGFCRPLYDLDFEERPWVPHSGWPITRRDVDPYYPVAQELCQVGPFDYEPDAWELSAAPPLPLQGDAVCTRLIQFSPPTRFGVLYRDQLFSSRTIEIYLHSTAISIVPTDNGREISRLDVGTLVGNRYSVKARAYIIAAGGIDNARILLASNQVISHGVGNDHDLVGRFFADHINLDTAAIYPLDPSVSFALYQRGARTILRQPRAPGGRPTPVMGLLELTPETQRAERTLNYSCEIGQTYFSDYFLHTGRYMAPDKMFRDESRSWIDDFAEIVKSLWRNLGDAVSVAFRTDSSTSGTFYGIRTVQEQAPNPDSRVMLSDARDKLGVPLADLQWRLGDLDRFTVKVAMDRLSQSFGMSDLGRLRVGIDLEAREWPTHMQGSWHHCGTTRMHSDPSRGVVDSDCKVHNISNLFVAGSSVFPTIGSANPTLTIVALAARLTDHLLTLFR